MFCISCKNSGRLVYCYQDVADLVYVFIPVPSIHLYTIYGVLFYTTYFFRVKKAVYTWVVSRVWSDNPFRMSRSHYTRYIYLLDIIKSIQDLSLPLWKVWHAGGPGYIPLRIFHPYSSHMSMSQGALLHVILSWLFLIVLVSFMVGDNVPTRVFQSPQIMWMSLLGMSSNMSYMYCLVSSSSIPLLARFGAGGIYTLPIHSYSPPCMFMHIFCAYSLPLYYDIFMPLRTITAIPPLLPLFLLSSKTWYPGISSFT